MGCYGGSWGQITRIVGLGWTGLVSPFSPIFDSFPPFFLRSFHQCTPPPHKALLPIKTVFVGLFQPQNYPFFHRASKFSHTLPHFPPFFLNQPISDKCTEVHVPETGIAEAWRSGKSWTLLKEKMIRALCGAQSLLVLDAPGHRRCPSF